MPETTTSTRPAATLPSTHSAAGVYASMKQVEEAIRRLTDAGIPPESISIIGKDLQSETEIHGFVTAKDLAKEGATFGAWVGGLFGLLTGAAMFFLPGGPLFVLGPLAYTAIGAAEGAVWTGAVGALLGHFLAKQHIPKLTAQLKAGKYLVVVHGTEDQVRRAQAILESTGATDVSVNDTAQAA
ncbi:MAG TPA: general stress protein [Candidatus Dormibacteraeota bacterium]|jgi:hypothetical protein|nr:general stress protein [Candidatus Dormibacteraeota bacterium]